MATYTVTGINLGGFNLGETDRVLSIFTAERGLIRAVAKGARKPGSKIAGRAEPLNVNSLLIASGRSIDIISQAESLETFPKLRGDLKRLAYALYFAELTQTFGQGLEDESGAYLEYLRAFLRQLNVPDEDPLPLCLRFETGLLALLGYQPELTYCVVCREILTEVKLGAFHADWGGIVCSDCMQSSRGRTVSEYGQNGGDSDIESPRAAVQITPLVWKQLVLATVGGEPTSVSPPKTSLRQPVGAAHRLLKSYLEHRAGKRLKALDLVKDM